MKNEAGEYIEDDVLYDKEGNEYLFKRFYDKEKRVVVVTIPNDKDKDPWTYAFIADKLSIHKPKL